MPTPAKTIRGKQLLVQISDGASPENFVADCLINTDRGIRFTSDTTSDTVAYCDEPDSPAWTEIDKNGLTATIPGSGKLHTSSVEEWFEWYTSNDAKNCRVLLNGVAAADGGGYWEGAFKLTEWEVTGPEKEKVTSAVTLVSHGPVTWVPAE
jgi:hypothetical protein